MYGVLGCKFYVRDGNKLPCICLGLGLQPQVVVGIVPRLYQVERCVLFLRLNFKFKYGVLWVIKSTIVVGINKYQSHCSA